MRNSKWFASRDRACSVRNRRTVFCGHSTLCPYSLINLTLLLIFSFSVQAQQPVRHNCWDIDYPQCSTPPLSRGGAQRAEGFSPFYTPLPYFINQADSGLMVIAMAKEYLGTPYRYGGKTPKGFDCAGFARYIYLHFGRELPGWSGAQAKLGIEVSDTRNLQPGDLVFFGGRHSHKAVGHTGIAIQTDTATGVFTFIHSATHGGVIISRSTEPYYKERYLTARRLFK